jgi:Lon protease-like protein
MFPLGSVLFPSVFLPLHVFEERYRALVRRCLASEPEFGVVLIERGSEVGGNDVRTMVGTVARILDARELDDGRWMLGTVGTRRIRVREWLRDDPYPRADVFEYGDADSPRTTHADQYDAVVAQLRRVLALKAELAEPAAPATVELADDWRLGSFQAAAVAPFGPADQQRLLALPSAGERLDMLGTLLDEEASFLAQRLAGG